MSLSPSFCYGSDKTTQPCIFDTSWVDVDDCSDGRTTKQQKQKALSGNCPEPTRNVSCIRELCITTASGTKQLDLGGKWKDDIGNIVSITPRQNGVSIMNYYATFTITYQDGQFSNDAMIFQATANNVSLQGKVFTYPDLRIVIGPGGVLPRICTLYYMGMQPVNNCPLPTKSGVDCTKAPVCNSLGTFATYCAEATNTLPSSLATLQKQCVLQNQATDATDYANLQAYLANNNITFPNKPTVDCSQQDANMCNQIDQFFSQCQYFTDKPTQYYAQAATSCITSKQNDLNFVMNSQALQNVLSSLGLLSLGIPSSSNVNCGNLWQGIVNIGNGTNQLSVQQYATLAKNCATSNYFQSNDSSGYNNLVAAMKKINIVLPFIPSPLIDCSDAASATPTSGNCKNLNLYATQCPQYDASIGKTPKTPNFYKGYAETCEGTKAIGINWNNLSDWSSLQAYLKTQNVYLPDATTLAMMTPDQLSTDLDKHYVQVSEAGIRSAPDQTYADLAKKLAYTQRTMYTTLANYLNNPWTVVKTNFYGPYGGSWIELGNSTLNEAKAKADTLGYDIICHNATQAGTNYFAAKSTQVDVTSGAPSTGWTYYQRKPAATPLLPVLPDADLDCYNEYGFCQNMDRYANQCSSFSGKTLAQYVAQSIGCVGSSQWQASSMSQQTTSYNNLRTKALANNLVMPTVTDAPKCNLPATCSNMYDIAQMCPNKSTTELQNTALGCRAAAGSTDPQYTGIRTWLAARGVSIPPPGIDCSPLKGTRSDWEGNATACDQIDVQPTSCATDTTIPNSAYSNLDQYCLYRNRADLTKYETARKALGVNIPSIAYYGPITVGCTDFQTANSNNDAGDYTYSNLSNHYSFCKSTVNASDDSYMQFYINQLTKGAIPNATFEGIMLGNAKLQVAANSSNMKVTDGRAAAPGCSTPVVDNVRKVIKDTDGSFQSVKVLDGANYKASTDSTRMCFFTGPEVFNIGTSYVYTRDQAAAACTALGAKQATVEQVKQAWRDGAAQCSWGHTTTDPVYPMQDGPIAGCNGNKGPAFNQMANFNPATPSAFWNNGLYGAMCYGMKPAKGTTVAANVLPFNGTQWNSPRATSKSTYTPFSVDSAINVYCAEPDYISANNYASSEACLLDKANKVANGATVASTLDPVACQSSVSATPYTYVLESDGTYRGARKVTVTRKGYPACNTSDDITQLASATVSNMQAILDFSGAFYKAAGFSSVSDCVLDILNKKNKTIPAGYNQTSTVTSGCVYNGANPSKGGQNVSYTQGWDYVNNKVLPAGVVVQDCNPCANGTCNLSVATSFCNNLYSRAGYGSVDACMTDLITNRKAIVSIPNVAPTFTSSYGACTYNASMPSKGVQTVTQSYTSGWDAASNSFKAATSTSSTQDCDPCLGANPNGQISQECYKKVWAGAGCATDPSGNWAWAQNQSMTTLVNDSAAWASMLDKTHVEGCYGAGKWPKFGRPSVGDVGYGDQVGHMSRGWYDVLGQGVANDYCRYVGYNGLDDWACHLSGNANKATSKYGNPTVYANTYNGADLRYVSGMPCTYAETVTQDCAADGSVANRVYQGTKVGGSSSCSASSYRTESCPCPDSRKVRDGNGNCVWTDCPTYDPNYGMNVYGETRDGNGNCRCPPDQPYFFSCGSGMGYGVCATDWQTATNFCS